VSEYLVRLWVHEAQDGLVQDITIRADKQIHAAAVALHHFISIGVPIRQDAYLECEPREGLCLRVCDVIDWLQSPEGHAFAGEWNLSREFTIE
jgi:hypothetical protein